MGGCLSRLAARPPTRRLGPAVGEIWVAEGTYTPAPPGGDRDASFDLISGVGLYGGFAGTESSRDARQPLAVATVLSGDLNGDDTWGYGNRSDNAYNVVRAVDVSADTVLDGFFISGGNATGACCVHDRGGGLYVEESALVVNTCWFEDNFGTLGGGVCNNGADSILTDCIFMGNDSAAGGGAVYNHNSAASLTACVLADNVAFSGSGGAIGNFNSSPTIDGCYFQFNDAPTGGAVSNAAYSRPTVRNCDFTMNSAQNGAAAASFGSGATYAGCRFHNNDATSTAGAIFGSLAFDTVENCTFEQNYAFSGGAIGAANGEVVVRDSLFETNMAERGGALQVANADLVGCTFLDNRAFSEQGGAIFAWFDGTIRVDRCSFLANRAKHGGGIASYVSKSALQLSNSRFLSNNAGDGYGGAVLVFGGAQATIRNCSIVHNFSSWSGGGVYAYPNSLVTCTSSILWDNSVGGTFSQSTQIDAGGTLEIDYSCVQFWTGSLGGTGNTASDPLFHDPNGGDDAYGTTDDDLRLGVGSPAINSGDPAY